MYFQGTQRSQEFSLNLVKMFSNFNPYKIKCEKILE